MDEGLVLDETSFQEKGEPHSAPQARLCEETMEEWDFKMFWVVDHKTF